MIVAEFWSSLGLLHTMDMDIMSMRVSLAKIQCQLESINEKSAFTSKEEECISLILGVDEVDLTRVDEPSRGILLTIHDCWYPISREVLLEVFSKSSHRDCVEKIAQYAETHFLVQFDSILNARVAQMVLNDQHIYENCCRLQVQFFHRVVNEELEEHKVLCDEVGQLDTLDELNSNDEELNIGLSGDTYIGDIEGHPNVIGFDSTEDIQEHTLRFEEFDHFWMATLDSTIKVQQGLVLKNLVSTCNKELFLNSMAQQHLMKFILMDAYVLRRTILRDYDGFNGPGNFQVAFTLTWSFIRDYDGFNGPGHLEDKVFSRGRQCYDHY